MQHAAKVFTESSNPLEDIKKELDRMIRMEWALEQLEANSGVKGRMAKVIWWTEEMNLPVVGDRVNVHYPGIVMDYMGRNTLACHLVLSSEAVKQKYFVKCLDQLVRFERAGILQTDMKSKNVVVNDKDDLTIIDYGSCQLEPEDGRYEHSNLYTYEYQDTIDITERQNSYTGLGYTDGKMNGESSSLFAMAVAICRRGTTRNGGVQPPATMTPGVHTWCYNVMRNRQADRWGSADLLRDTEIQEVAKENGVSLPPILDDEGVRRGGESADDMRARAGELKREATTISNNVGAKNEELAAMFKAAWKLRKEIDGLAAKARLKQRDSERLSLLVKEVKEEEEAAAAAAAAAAYAEEEALTQSAAAAAAAAYAEEKALIIQSAAAAAAAAYLEEEALIRSAAVAVAASYAEEAALTPWAAAGAGWAAAAALEQATAPSNEGGGSSAGMTPPGSVVTVEMSRKREREGGGVEESKECEPPSAARAQAAAPSNEGGGSSAGITVPGSVEMSRKRERGGGGVEESKECEPASKRSAPGGCHGRGEGAGSGSGAGIAAAASTSTGSASRSVKEEMVESIGGGVAGTAGGESSGGGGSAAGEVFAPVAVPVVMPVPVPVVMPVVMPVPVMVPAGVSEPARREMRASTKRKTEQSREAAAKKARTQGPKTRSQKRKAEGGEEKGGAAAGPHAGGSKRRRT
ncbi:unnamed protein product [Ectocarpus sp. 8 AP-2014]